MTKNKKDPAAIINNVRHLDPDLPFVHPDGLISIEQEGDTFRLQTVGRLVAFVVAGTKQQLSGLEAACAFYISRQLYAGERLKLDKEVVEVIVKCLDHGLENGYFLPPVHAVVSWLVRPEDIPDAYRGALESLYEEMPGKRKEARGRIATLTAQLSEAKAQAAQQKERG